MKKKYFMILSILVFLVGVIGISYAYWMQSETQTEENIVGSDCFKLTILNEGKGIELNNAHPVTDEDGKKEEGYSFTIQNVCNKTAYYQVNLEEMGLAKEEKVLSEQYIKLSLNDSDGRKITDYEEVKKTIDGSVDSHKITSGSLGPQEEKQYTLKLWMDYDTPAKEEVMNATYESKVSIIATELEESKLENSIEIAFESKETEYRNDKETIEITATSTNYNITEYSYDGTIYQPITPSKNVTIEKEETEEGTHPVYFRDEVGNVQEGNYETSKLDKIGPTIDVLEESDENGANLTITFTDNKSGLKEYIIVDKEMTLENEEEQWESITGETANVTYLSNESKVILIKVKDQAGNESEQTFIIDIKSPSLTVTNPSEGEWTKEDLTITITSEDDISGIDKFYYRKKTEPEEEWQEIENQNIEGKIGTATITINETTDVTYEFKVIDKKGNENIDTSVVKIDKDKPIIENVFVGSMMYDDPTFAKDTNHTVLYNNLQNGNLTIVRELMDTPYGRTYGLTIKNIGEAYPGLGGFVFGTPATPNRILITRIIAKIPLGYQIWSHANFLGTNSIQKWLTSLDGTGEWKEYIYYLRVGSDGNGSGANYFALHGPVGSVEKPVIWHVAYATVFDIGVYGTNNYAFVTGTDNVAIDSYGFNQSPSVEPSYTKASDPLHFAAMYSNPINANTNYYVWLKDPAGNVNYKLFNTNNLTNTVSSNVQLLFKDEESISIKNESEKESEDLYYYFELNNGMKQISQINEVVFSNLPPGEYTVKTGILDNKKQLKSISNTSFSIP